MSAIALIAAAPLALVQSNAAALTQAPMTQSAVAQTAVVQAAMIAAPAAQPQAEAEAAHLAPQAVLARGPISQGSADRTPIVQPPVVPAPAARPLASAEVAQLAPQAAFASPPAGPSAEFRIQAEGTAVAQPQSPMAQPIVMSYRLAADESGVQGPPAPDPMANDIAWANGQTAQHRAEVGRQGWQKIVPYEIAWQVLNALDLAQTLDCTHRADCHEANPILGHRPSDGVVIGVKGGMAIVHFLLMRHIAHRNWKTARAAELGTILVQGIIDGLNFRYAFK